MIGAISIEYRAGTHVVPTILAMIEEAGYTLRGIKNSPCADGAQATLSLDLDGYSSIAELAALAERIQASSAVLDVTHLAGSA